MVPKSEVLQINLNLVQGLFAMWLFIYLFIYSFIYSFIYLLNFYQLFFFSQIYSQNLKLSKLTEIWCRATLLYAFHEFNVHFFKNVIINIVFLLFQRL